MKISEYIFIGILLLFITMGVFAAPPIDSDPSLAPWFRSLKQPGNGLSCCDMSDCRPVNYRMDAHGYEVYITKQDFLLARGSQWVRVPEEKILSPRSNPTGSAVVCWSPYSGVLCFVTAGGV